jgi:alcohol dehydrogenase
LLQRAEQLLTEAGVHVVLFDEVVPNPRTAEVLEGAARARHGKCDLVVGLGGGSAMDAAKAIAVAATHDEPLWEFIIPPPGVEKRQPTARTLPIVCVPTTAGTASELTPFAVISNPDTTEKASFASDYALPRVAISDPELTYSMPPEVTAVTGLDVFAHAVESFISKVASPVTDAADREAMRRVGQYLRRAVADGQDEEAREQMLLASTFAGMGLSNTGATIMHALEHPISAILPQVAHGAGLSAQMSAYIRFVTPAAPEKVAEVGEMLEPVGANSFATSVGAASAADLDDACRHAHEAVDRLVADVGAPQRLGPLGVTEELIPCIADEGLRYMSGALGKCPRDATRDDLIQFLQDCL